MISPENRQILIDLGHTHQGRVLLDIIKEEEDKLRDVNTCRSYDEVLGRQFALKALSNIFSLLKNEQEVAKGKNIYE